MDPALNKALDPSISVCSDGYNARVDELRAQLALLQQQCRTGGHNEELKDLLHQQIRSHYASLWALHAELESE